MYITRQLWQVAWRHKLASQPCVDSCEVNMPMMANCSSRVCPFQVVLQDITAGDSIPTLEECPICGSAVITRCLCCRFMILGVG